MVPQVFSKADIWFSLDGDTYEEEPLSYSYIPDIVLENARNVSIGLHERLGRFLKIHLYFAARWIMISEVTFEGSKSFTLATRSFIDHSRHERSRGNILINPQARTGARNFSFSASSSLRPLSRFVSLSVSLSSNEVLRNYRTLTRSLDRAVIKIVGDFRAVS